jgi:hypothetical protein
LAKYGSGSELLIGYDETGETPEQADVEQSPAKLVRELLGGYSKPISNNWEARKQALLTTLNRRNGLLIDPQNKELISALSTRWYYKQNRLEGIAAEKPDKAHPWSDYGDALCYLLCLLGQVRGTDTVTSYKIERNLSW